MKKLKRILAAALSVLTLSACSITVNAEVIDPSEDENIAKYDMLIDPNYPAEITVSDYEVGSKFYYKNDKKILLEFADNVDVSDFNLKYDFEKADHTMIWREFTGNPDNFYACNCVDLSISELINYAAELREMDGIITAEPVIISYQATCGLFNSSEKTGLTISVGGGKSLDELKADKELCAYVDSIGGVITTRSDMLDSTKEVVCITGIADREHFREIITKINSFESVNNNAFYSFYTLASLSYKVRFLENNQKGDINNDGKITAADASIAFSAYKKNYTSGGTGLSELELYNADFNGDGKVTAEDASEIFSQYKKTYQS